MVFQSYALYPNMNVYENIRFPLKVRGVDPSTHDEKVKRASAMVELDEFGIDAQQSFRVGNVKGLHLPAHRP